MNNTPTNKPDVANQNPSESTVLLNSSREEIRKSLESEKEYFAVKVGSYLHEEWRKTRLKEDGTYEPRWKEAKDEEWSKAHGGAKEIDIANTRFEDLSSAWQHENLEGGKVAVDLVYEKVINGEEITPEMIEEMSSIVHEKWLERNPREKDGKLGVPYSQLPENEKAKDRVQIEVAIRFIKSEK